MIMKPLQRRNSLLLVLAAFIWGIAFVAQSEGGKSIGPYTFNGIRFLLGAAVLCPVIFLMNKKNAAGSNEAKPANRRVLQVRCSSWHFFTAPLPEKLDF